MFGGVVHRPVVGLDRPPRDRGDHLGCADHGTAEGMGAEDRLCDQVVDEVLRGVLVHGDLLQHDLALCVELLEERRADHLAHDRKRDLEVVGGDTGVEERVLARGRRVQLRAEAVEDLGDLECAVARRALEEEVLDEVRDAGLRIALVARPGVDPVADRDRARLLESLGDHPLARVQLGQCPVLHGLIVRCGAARKRSRPALSTARGSIGAQLARSRDKGRLDAIYHAPPSPRVGGG